MGGRGRSEERIVAHLFGEGSALPALNRGELATKEVYEQVFALWFEHPERTDRQMVAWVEEQFGRSRRQAMADVANVKSLLGRVVNAQREWHRYTVLEMLREAYQLARDAGDVVGMVRAASQIGRYTQLDKPEPEGVDWSQLEAPSFEPTADASLLGITGAEDMTAARARLERKYGVVLVRGAEPHPAPEAVVVPEDDGAE